MSAEPAIATFTASDGYRWHYRHYPSAGTPRARVVALHGIQSHGGWYEESSRILSAGGYEVFYLDRRGSGLNEVNRGDAPSFLQLLRDIAAFLKFQRQQPGPVFLMAVSWGGKLAVALQCLHPGLVDGLILLCPGLCPQVGPTWRERVGIAICCLFAPRRLFPIPLSDPELFTATPSWQQFLRDDPLALHRATARFLAASFRLDLFLNITPRFVRVPTLLLLAGRDRVIDNARTRRFVDRFATPDRTVIEYPEAHHTLEFEPDPAPVWRDLLGWLDRHVVTHEKCEN
jgi:alpha-beta hydrolase superfamily lysophospholipase